MAGKSKRASPGALGEGKRIRRARNIVRRWQRGSDPPLGGSPEYHEVWDAIRKRRYERAVAILVRAALLG